jgi:hypothetical protein
MSYNFTVRAKSASLALLAVNAQLQAIAAAQPPHKLDHDHILKNAASALGMLAEAGEGQEVVIQLNGYLSGKLDWSGTGAPQEISAASICASASLQAVSQAAEAPQATVAA